MDVHQLTLVPGRTVWTLRDGSPSTDETSRVDATPWWLLDPERPSGAEPLANGDAARPARSGAVRGARRTPRGAGVALLVAGVLLLAAAGGALLAGLRPFVVETPSMGTAAPVGSLVVTAPAPARLRIGDVIAFVPPGTPRTYTHRVLSVGPDGAVRTKGDVNASPDPWTVRPGAILGRAVAVLPGAGFAVRGLPVVLLGGAVLLLVTAPIRRRDVRAAVRVIGGHLLVTAALLWLRPLVRVVLIATEAAADGAHASVVSTGLLPIRLVTSSGQLLARLADGRPQTVLLPPAGAGLDRVLAVPDLGPAVQLGLIAIAAAPALIVLLVGLPRDERVAA